MREQLVSVGDVALGATALGVGMAIGAARIAGRTLAPVVPVLAHPPLVPPSWAPATLVQRLADQGRTTRTSMTAAATSLADQLVPVMTDEVLDRIDLTEVALTRLDIERIVKATLAELDLNAVVRDNVDVVGLAESTISAMDLDAIVREQVDIVGIAEYVIDEIDLPEIIRESSGMVASEAVRGVRMQSIEADEALSRLVDRILLRRKQRRTDAPGVAPSERAGSETETR